MLIAEHFFLIACDPRSGRLEWPSRQSPDRLAAAAILLDLARADRLQLAGDSRLHADASFPLAHALPNDALHLLALHPLPVGTALQRLTHELAPLAQEILDGLFRRDVLHCVVTRDWLLRRHVRYPLRSMQARNEALQKLRTDAGGTDFLRMSLVMLTDQSGLLARLLPAREHALAMQRMLALDAADATQPAWRRILALLRAALLAA